MRIEDYKSNEEMVLWKGKPNKSVYIKEKIFTPLAIFALIWMVFDMAFICCAFASASGIPGPMRIVLVPFFIFHLLPVWIYLGNIIFSVRSWNNTEYMVTDRAIYATSGVFTTKCDRKTFQEVTNVSFHQGIIDKKFNVGDVFIATGQTVNTNGRVKQLGINIIDIDDYLKVYKLITRTGTDIYSDTMYPNDLRPKENHGYKTSYTPEDYE